MLAVTLEYEKPQSVYLVSVAIFEPGTSPNAKQEYNSLDLSVERIDFLIFYPFSSNTIFLLWFSVGKLGVKAAPRLNLPHIRGTEPYSVGGCKSTYVSGHELSRTEILLFLF